MDSSRPDKFFLRSTSTVPLNERFSQVLVDQLTQSRMATFDPVLQQRTSGGVPHLVLLVRRASRRRRLQVRQCLRRRSVWTRLGRPRTCCRSASRRRGFWSFMKKYSWRSSFTSICRGRGDLRSRLVQRRFLRTKNIQKVTAGHTHLQRGGANASRGRGLRRAHVPSRKELDAQLDEYMSMSRSRLDAQLDEYMSTSKRRLDAQLDEYMSMCGQTHWD